MILSFLVAKRNYLPIQYLLNTVKASDQELEQSGVMDELGDLEIYVKKTIRTRQEMNEKNPPVRGEYEGASPGTASLPGQSA